MSLFFSLNEAIKNDHYSSRPDVEIEVRRNEKRTNLKAKRYGQVCQSQPGRPTPHSQSYLLHTLCSAKRHVKNTGKVNTCVLNVNTNTTRVS